MRLWAAAAFVCLGCLLAHGQSASASAVARPAGASSSRASGVTAWLPYWEMPSALSSTLKHGGAIGTATPYWYDISGDDRVHDEAGAGSPAVIAELQAGHQQVVPMVTEEAGIGAFARILESSVRRTRMVRTLVKIASHAGYSGLDLDFESFAVDPQRRTTLANRVAALYPALVAQTCAGLHAIGRSCQVTVMARTGPARVYAHGDIAPWVYDYAALAKAADRVQIMAYDDHSPGGRAGPIAPLPWVRQVVAYALTQGQPIRYELGLAAYGYEWYGRTSATAIYARQVPALLAQLHARQRWSVAEGEETFRFRSHGHRVTVWYEDARADVERARLAALAGFSGVAVWAAGYEQSQLWQQLHDLSG